MRSRVKRPTVKYHERRGGNIGIEEFLFQDGSYRKSLLLGNAPTAEEPRRVILDTDAHNEIDDQMAIVHALLSDELKVEGIIASHYGIHTHRDSMEQSYLEIQHLLRFLGMEGKVPVLKGSPSPLEEPQAPQRSEAAEFIISCVKSSHEPVYIACLGPLPEIAEKVVVLWIGGGLTSASVPPRSVAAGTVRVARLGTSKRPRRCRP